MKYPKDRNIHRPCHIDQQERPYFITGKTYFGLPYFETSKAKEALLQAIGLAARNYGLVMDAWVILDNHYHLLFRPPGSAVPEGLPRSDDFSRYGGTQVCQSVFPGVTDLSVILERSNKQVCHYDGCGGVTALAVTRPFSIGKVMGTIHGKSSSLLKGITRKRVTPSTNGSDSFNPRERSDNFSCYYNWWEAKYWDGVKSENINLYGRRSVLADKKRSEEFRRLLREGTPQELADFVRELGSVWYQYVDRVIRDERDYFMHFNYIHQNPVKHGYVRRLSDYQFSSIHKWVEEGKEWLADCFRKYPVVDFEPEMGDFN